MTSDKVTNFGRRGFTFIELLVVTAVLAVLFALLIPAVQQSREAARRSSCKNNLHQLGVALHTYYDLYEMFPAGTTHRTGPIRNEPSGYHHSWSIALLPCIEQRGIAGMIDPKKDIYDLAHRPARRIPIPMLFCPSDTSKRSASVTGELLEPQLTNYAGCHHPVEAPIDADNRGVLYLNSFVRIPRIADGTSQTLVVGEFRRAMDDLGWASGTRATLRNCGIPINQTPGGGAYYQDPDFRLDVLSRLSRVDPQHVGKTADEALKAARDPERFHLVVGGFGSNHAGGGQFLMTDGSVRFISENIPPDVFSALGDRADGLLLPEF